MNITQDQLAEILEQGKAIYVKKNRWYKKLGLIRQEQENGNRNDRISSVRRYISDHS